MEKERCVELADKIADLLGMSDEAREDLAVLSPETLQEMVLMIEDGLSMDLGLGEDELEDFSDDDE